MVLPTMRVLVLGHSFIVRFKKILQEKIVYPEYDDTFGTHHIVKMVGFPGGTICTLKRRIGEYIGFRPRRVFLQCGGNDIRDPLTAVQIADRIINFANLLIWDYGVEDVFIGRLVRRGWSKRMKMGVSRYTEIQKDVNRILKSECDRSNGLWFWTGSGLSPANSDYLCRDQTHFNHVGYRRYFKSIRQALLKNSSNTAPAPRKRRGKRGGQKQRWRRGKKTQ